MTETRSEGEDEEEEESEEDEDEDEKDETEEKEEKEEKGDPQGKVLTTQKRGRRGARDSSPLHVSREVETRLDDVDEETSPGPKRQKTAHSSSEDADDDVVGTAMDTTATAVTTAAAQDETGTVAMKVQVTALQLCGLEAFSVFDAAERDAIQRLLVVSDDVLAPLHQYHETFLDVSREEASRRVARLRPEYPR